MRVIEEGEVGAGDAIVRELAGEGLTALEALRDDVR